ncbi:MULTISPECIES: RNA 2',3'-cyclic phosphodiesterase [unclassified Streptosporangium]|uniref:RNA 2',3'-cyclic phosphodiesterase n=1 Tax=unclassified Streptosporangium TaxID=2632669 RepID=UPI002E27D37F|nr:MULTISPECIES: RNA 2',3'-cyclic phosphodiesterase [unclassified Streptosporangium]
MRLFVGLLPPPPVRDELILALEAHRPRWPGLRWLDPATWHVTLSFFGEVPEQVLPELRTRLADVAAHHAPMTLSLTGAGAFPSAGAARVFLTGLGGDRPELARLADRVGAEALGAGAGQTDRRRFTPHLSLARCRADTDVSPLVEAFGAFSGTAWEAGTVHLMRSDFGGGARYQTVEEWPLTARAPRGQS